MLCRVVTASPGDQTASSTAVVSDPLNPADLEPFRYDPEIQCTATSKRTHQRCRRARTPGVNVCWWHGAAAPQVRAAAERNLRRMRAEGKIAALVDAMGEADDLHPLEVLVAAVGRAHRAAALLEVLVSDLSPHPVGDDGEATAGLYGPDHLGDARPHVLVELLRQWNTEAGRLSKMAVDAGVEERRVRVVEEQAHGIARAVSGVALALIQQLVAVGVDPAILARFQRDDMPAIMRRELLAAAS